MTKIDPDRPIPYALTERAACARDHGASGQDLGRSPAVLPSQKQGVPEASAAAVTTGVPGTAELGVVCPDCERNASRRAKPAKPGERPREAFVRGLLTAIAAETDCRTCVRLLLELEGAMVAMRRLTVELKADLEKLAPTLHTRRIRTFNDEAAKPGLRVKAARRAYMAHVEAEGCI